MSAEGSNLTLEELEKLSARQLAAHLDARSKYDVALVSKPGKLKRLKVSYGNHRVWLQKRRGGASIQLEVSRSDRRSLATANWMEALEEAERHVRQEVLAHHEDDALEREFIATAGNPDLLFVEEFYRSKRFIDDRNHKDYVGPDHRKRLERVWDIVRYKFGMRRPVSWFDKRFVAKYVALRTSETIVFPEHYGRRPCDKVTVRTAIRELKDFSGAVTFAVKEEKVKANPLEDYQWDHHWLQGDQHAVRHMEAAHTRRHGILMARSQRMDPQSGNHLPAPVNRIRSNDRGARVRCIEALLFHHGHRTVSVLSLMCEDVAFNRQEMRALLNMAPNHRDWWADHWPHGAIFWRRSKVDYLRVTPMSKLMRMELDRWRAEHPDWRTGVPVFPQMSNILKPLVYDQVNKWMHQAIEIAREDLQALQVPTERIDRWLTGGLLHGWRSHWATMMDELGYGWDAVTKQGDSKLDLHNHVAFMGDWATSGGTQAEVYAKLNPGILQAVADFERAEEVVRRFSAKAADDLADVMGAIYGGSTDEDVIPITRGKNA